MPCGKWGEGEEGVFFCCWCLLAGGGGGLVEPRRGGRGRRKWRGLTYGCGAGFEEEGGLVEPLGGVFEVDHFGG